MSIFFSHEKKKKMAERIQKLTSKHDLIQIKKIIVDNNPNMEFMKNCNGYFLQFQNLSTDSYQKITEFFDLKDKYDEKKKLDLLENEILDNSDISSEDNTSDQLVSKRLRLTNTESHILNRIRYENALKHNDVQEPVKQKKSQTVFAKK